MTVLQETLFWPTTISDGTEVGLASITVPDQGGPYVLDVSATVGIAAANAHVSARLRLDQPGGTQLGVDCFRSGALPAGEVIPLVHPPVTTTVLVGTHTVIVTAQRIGGSGSWANGSSNLLRVAVRAPERLLTVLGDSYASGQPAIGGIGPRGWPYRVGMHLTGDCLNYALGGTGYVNGAGGPTFGQRASLVPASSQTVIVFGSLNDETLGAQAVGTAAAQCYAAIAQRAPSARLNVVGPQWPNAQHPADLLAVSAAVKAAALAAGALFIDPLAEGWFDNRPDLIGADGWHPTDAGHAYIAAKIEAHL